MTKSDHQSQLTFILSFVCWVISDNQQLQKTQKRCQSSEPWVRRVMSNHAEQVVSRSFTAMTQRNRSTGQQQLTTTTTTTDSDYWLRLRLQTMPWLWLRLLLLRYYDYYYYCQNRPKTESKVQSHVTKRRMWWPSTDLQLPGASAKNTAISNQQTARKWR